MPNKRYFDVKRDNEIINGGGFFCHTCLVGKPASEVSPDPRYCKSCYGFLLQESEMNTRRRGSDWKPKMVYANDAQVLEDVRGIMSTLHGRKSQVDIIHPAIPANTSDRRGPKHRQLPEDLIRQLNDEGMGSKAIASELRNELKITVSYKTIQRLLSGERKQPMLGKAVE